MTVSLQRAGKSPSNVPKTRRDKLPFVVAEVVGVMVVSVPSHTGRRLIRTVAGRMSSPRRVAPSTGPLQLADPPRISFHTVYLLPDGANSKRRTLP